MASTPAVATGAWAVAEPPRRFRLHLGRLLVAVGLLALGVALIAFQQQVRVIEAAAARPPLGILAGRAVHVPGTDLVFYPDYAGPGLRALEVTFSCSSVPLVAPLAFLGSVLAGTRRLAPLRVLVGIGTAIVAVFAVNLVRIVLIALATTNFGVDGYELSHRVVGSAVTVAGACLAFALTYRIVTARAQPGHRGA